VGVDSTNSARFNPISHLAGKVARRIVSIQFSNLACKV
jgi:hypothetical protein